MCPYFNIALVILRNVDFLQISLLAGGGGAATPVRAPVKETMFEEMARKVFFLSSVLWNINLRIAGRKERSRQN